MRTAASRARVEVPTETIVPKRVDPLRIRPDGQQQAWLNSKARFNVVPAGRRSLKTEIAKRKTVRCAFTIQCDYDDPRFFLGGPTRDQAKAIFWQDLKRMIPRSLMLRPPIETELRIDVVTGAELHVVGMDKPERIEGRPWDGGVLDEYADMKGSAWPENVRPALADRGGWCDFIGVPGGRNHYHDLAKYAQSGVDPEWAFFTWFSSDILPPEEIESAKRFLDELVFQQEFEASFINFEGRAYYPFTSATHCAPLKYDPRQPLILCFDFNVEPGVCAIAQEQLLPKQYEHAQGGAVLLNRPITGTGIIGEVHIPRNSNTPAVCRAILANRDGTPSVWAKHQGPVRCYGDATGGARGTAKVQGSDWELIEKELRPTFKDQLAFRVKAANPPERARVNAMNSRFKSSTGDVRMMVDPAKAPNVVKDFEGVTLLKGGSGEIDKKATPVLTHLSDGVGYYIESVFPVSGPGLVKVQLGGI
jgi:hypothetical protein